MKPEEITQQAEQVDFAYEPLSLQQWLDDENSLDQFDVDGEMPPDTQLFRCTAWTYTENGYQKPFPEAGLILYSETLGRMGVTWGGDPSWADVNDVESGLQMYLNDGEAWSARN